MQPTPRGIGRAFLVAGMLLGAGFWLPARAADPAERLVIQADRNTVRSVAFSPDGKMLATGGYENGLRLWDVLKGHELPVLDDHVAWILAVAFSPDGRTIAASSKKSLTLWNLETRKVITKVTAGGVLAVAFSPDGQTIAFGGQESGVVRLWDLKTRKEQARLKPQNGDDLVFSLKFSPDGKVLAASSFDSQTELAIVRDGDRISPGKILSGNGATITFWDVPERRARTAIRRLRGVIWSVDFSPDGKTLAYGGEDPGKKAALLRLWDLTTRRDRLVLEGHTDRVHPVAFRPDGKVLASAGRDMRVKLWDTVTGRELATLKGHTNMVKCLAFSPDGKTLASGSWDGTARLWDVPMTLNRPVKSAVGNVQPQRPDSPDQPR